MTTRDHVVDVRCDHHATMMTHDHVADAHEERDICRTQRSILRLGTAVCEFENADSLWTFGARHLRAPSSYTLEDPLLLGDGIYTTATAIDVSRPIRARYVTLHCTCWLFGVATIHKFQFIPGGRHVVALFRVARLLVPCRQLSTHSVARLLWYVYVQNTSAWRHVWSADFITPHPLTLERIVLAARDPALVAGWSDRRLVEYVAECQRQLGYECMEVQRYARAVI